jgi:hypothetical protein
MDSVFELPTYDGWTVDARLREFRKSSLSEEPMIAFIRFDSDEGQEMIEEMQEYFGFLYE